jgi:hypothetical protein
VEDVYVRRVSPGREYGRCFWDIEEASCGDEGEDREKREIVGGGGGGGEGCSCGGSEGT